MARVKYYNPNTGHWEYADNITSAYPVVSGQTQIIPGRYHVFGEVDELSVTLIEVDDGNVHEYQFEFIPSDNFTTFSIEPEPSWVYTPSIVKGKTHQVSILRGIGVMACA